MCINALSASMPAGKKRTSDPIIDGCEPPRDCWELNSGLLQFCRESQAACCGVLVAAGPQTKVASAGPSSLMQDPGGDRWEGANSPVSGVSRRVGGTQTSTLYKIELNIY